ncbi:MAG: AAA family ATPase [Pirellulales bacterium]
MFVSRLQIRNFRNFRMLDVALGGDSVFVGENKVGKSNLIHAIRLVLDPSLPDSARYLRLDDFWDGLPRPLARDHAIEVALDFRDFETRPSLLSLLADSVVETEPFTSRFTYRYTASQDTGEAIRSDVELKWAIFGGDRPDNVIPLETRRRLAVDVLPALRDAESDLQRWRASPLRPLMEQAASTIEPDELLRISGAITAGSRQLAAIPEVAGVAREINERLMEMVGAGHGLEFLLSATEADADKLVRSLRLFFDNGVRSISDASLGSANLLYLALKTLELRLTVEQQRRNFVFLAIEEPEAHLHPHLQRLVYSDFLRTRVEQDQPPEHDQLIFLTTHSPHVVSVSPVRSIVLLKRIGEPVETVALSSATLEFDADEVSDLERYLNVTRSELVFARGVILVEGMAEAFLVPAFAKLLGTDFDKLGITVCSVEGTHFAAYVKLLSQAGLDIPFSVITDLDPREDEPAGAVTRIRALLTVLGRNVDEAEGDHRLLEEGRSKGVFVNGSTLERELWTAGAAGPICQALEELAETAASRQRFKQWASTVESVPLDSVMSAIERAGKGRVAQRLASKLNAAICPVYIKEAIEHVTQQLPQ